VAVRLTANVCSDRCIIRFMSRSAVGRNHRSDAGAGPDAVLAVLLSRVVCAWAEYWKPVPAPGWHDLLALTKREEATLEGDLHLFMTHLQYFKDVLALPRCSLQWCRRDRPYRTDGPALRHVENRWANCTCIYFERERRGDFHWCACHTAGSDGRQWRHLLADEEVFEEIPHHRVRLPWHGKSNPPASWNRRGVID